MLTSPGATHRALLKAGAGLLSAAAVLAAVPGSALAAPVTASFATTGAPQTFTVPAGVRSVHAIAVGGSGGTSYYGYPGGRGAHVEADLSVTPGQLLYVYVGGNGVAGVSDGGYNGGGANPGVYGYGGAGGGGSDIRATAGDLDSRLLVAGGGGGAGLQSAGGDFDAGGTGPSAGAAGTLTGGGAGGNGAPSGSIGQGGAPGADCCGVTMAGGGGGGYFGGGGGGDESGAGGGSTYFGSSSSATSETLDTTGTPTISITFDEVIATDVSSLVFDPTPTQGTSAPKTVTVTNEGSRSITFTGEDFDFSGQGEDYFISSSTCRGTLAIGSSCVVRVRFAPQGTGGSTSALLISAAEADSGISVDTARVALSGTATGLPQGPAGADGTDGTAGADGVDGAAGADGVDGAAGADGVDGAAGADGVDGVAGADGVDGVAGADGTDGVAGADGVDGEAGADGTDGTDGIDAAAGAPGTDGVDGTNGVDGADGATGIAGRDGSPGTILRVRECHRKNGSGARTVVCYVRYTAAKGAQLNLSLRRNGVAVAAGRTTGSGGVQKITLKADRRLRRGLYRLGLSYHAGDGQRFATRSAYIR